MRARDLPSDHDVLLVRPWVDPVVDHVGHDPRSAYVERFWLGILGPSATWLLRYLVGRLDASPDGFDLDLDECATAIGLGRRQGPNAAFPRTITRCCQFGAARPAGTALLEVRRKLPPLTLRQVARLPDGLRAEHARWVDESPTATATVSDLRDRARRLALSLVELGEGPEGAEQQLHRWRFHPALASEATAWALERHASRRQAGAGGGASAPGDQQRTPVAAPAVTGTAGAAAAARSQPAPAVGSTPLPRTRLQPADAHG